MNAGVGNELMVSIRMVPDINRMKGIVGIVFVVGNAEFASGLPPTCHEVSGSSQYHEKLILGSLF